ncbi:MarR family winged helix-turn-helix transcriptional regulator [Salinarimonas soli]|uniref:Winged helix-turn-helix transcriptional regulator n=1 Tax=Salinarimonas soli TaxID=1638099 RepID=A0A5B2VEB7_9HYPH|nr:winged helix-turn-helix transcriptional regulator [Salinarimonas soli]
MRSRHHPGLESVGWALVQAARLHRARVSERLGAVGLFAGQESVILALADGPMTMGELADLLRVRPPTASKTVSRLSSAGLLERRAGSGDGRLVRVGLTSAGEAKARALAGLWDEIDEEMLAGLSRDERARLLSLLRRVADRPDGASGAEPYDPAFSAPA